ncbi:MAG: hypothetical protein ABH818_00080 [Patescibacteria group bacterium]|nr:hypothetical protein [Patescibacteria group bacterium]
MKHVPLFKSIDQKEKKFENFLKQLGDSPEKKRNISANVHASSEVLH